METMYSSERPTPQQRPSQEEKNGPVEDFVPQNVPLAEELFAKAHITDLSEDEREEVLGILSSKRILVQDELERIRTVLRLEGMEPERRRYFEERDTQRLYNQMVKNAFLDSEVKEILLGETIDFVSSEKIHTDRGEYDLKDLSDHERTDIGLENVKGIIRDLLNDENAELAQGAHWYVLVSKDNLFALKTEKPQASEGEKVRQRTMLLHYIDVRKHLSREFLPTQIVLKSKKSDTLHILQEAVDLGDSTAVNLGNIDDFVTGAVGQSIHDALRDNANKALLAKFITETRNLLDQEQLAIDFLGRNLYLRAGESGQLDIKLVDSGSFDARRDSDLEQVQEIREFLDKLEGITRKGEN